MFFKLFLLFVLLPLVELALLLQVGALVGLWPTIGLVLLTGAVGAALARSQGTRVLARIRGELASGRPPMQALLDGLLVLVGGIVLLTPGILTDLMGLALLLPPTRAPVRRWLERRFRRMVESGESSFVMLIR